MSADPVADTVPPTDGPTAARVVVLAGPSGCGKTHLAQLSGLPIISLDEFYRDGTEADMPRRPDGVIDWEDPSSWSADAALEALGEICRGDSVDIPIYSFGQDRAVGTRTIERGGSSIVIAEGIFAAELIEPLRERGLLADALLIRQNRWTTFLRRLARDFRDGRKGRFFLLRQGCGKAMAEPTVIERQVALGARPVARDEVLVRLGDLSGSARAVRR